MLCIIDKHTTNPYWNLAAEEYLLTSFHEPIFRLWRNRDSIIIGKNQNAYAEINTDFVEKRGIDIVRRLSGGGAVFHDNGNINYSFIDNHHCNESTCMMFKRFTSPIIDALNDLGVNASLSGRNDILIEGGKVSGNAILIQGGRVLQHGTLLFESSIDNLSAALIDHKDKFVGKAVKSNRSRVTNISCHLPSKITIDAFVNHIAKTVINRYKCTYYDYTEQDIRAIDTLTEEKYCTKEWNYGHCPRFSTIRRTRFEAGIVEIRLDVAKGIITNIDIYGDYFFKKPTEEFRALLLGQPYDKEKIIERLLAVTFDDYFCGIDTQDFVSLMFT